MVKTITLSGAELAVENITGQNPRYAQFRHVAVRNDSDSTVYISREAGIVQGADNVLSVKAGDSAVYPEAVTNTIYLLGTGTVTLMLTADFINPFKSAPTSGGGGGGSYTLPAATTSLLGGVIVGSNLHITPSGVLSAVQTAQAPVNFTIPPEDWTVDPDDDTVYFAEIPAAGFTANDAAHVIFSSTAIQEFIDEDANVSPAGSSAEDKIIVYSYKAIETDVSGCYVVFKGADDTVGYVSTNAARGSSDAPTPTTVEIPTLAETEYTYTGEEITALFDKYDTTAMTATGISHTDAGTYTATFVLRRGYSWLDGSSGAKKIEWTIKKAVDVITASETSVTISEHGETATVTVTHLASNALTVVSSDNSVVSVSTSGTNLVLTAEADSGEATITISSAGDGNYSAAADKTITVKIQSLVIKSFSECTEQEVVDMLAAHYADEIDITDYWSVGDTRTIAFAGTEATDTISTAHAACDMEIRIIGIEHDDLVTPINGHTKAAITCEFVNSLTNACYIWGVTRSGAASPTGGLQNSDVWSNNPRRTWLNSTFKAALPSTLSGAIKTVVKTTKSTHTGSTTENTNDDVFLLSVYEVYKDTDTNYANTTNKIAEGSQYKFYETSSNRVATDYYVGTSNRANHWLRSPASYYTSSYGYHWCRVYSESGAGSYDGAGTFGLAPAWCM